VSRGIRGRRQYEALSPGRRRYYEDVALRVKDRLRDEQERPHPKSFSKVVSEVLGRDIGGQDTRRIKALLGIDERGAALRRVGRRVEVRATSGLYHPRSMSVLTPDGIYTAVNLTDKQASMVGRYLSLMGRAGRMSEAELRKALAPFKGKALRVFDPETGKAVRLPFETRPTLFRRFSTSPEASDVTVYPRRQASSGRRAA